MYRTASVIAEMGKDVSLTLWSQYVRIKLPELSLLKISNEMVNRLRLICCPNVYSTGKECELFILSFRSPLESVFNQQSSNIKV